MYRFRRHEQMAFFHDTVYIITMMADDTSPSHLLRLVLAEGDTSLSTDVCPETLVRLSLDAFAMPEGMEAALCVALDQTVNALEQQRHNRPGAAEAL